MNKFVAVLLIMSVMIVLIVPTAIKADTVTINTVSATATVHCMVSVDGQWIETKALTTNKQANFNKARYTLSATELEQAYGEYGFSAADYKGELFFPHTDSYDSGNIWADTSAKYDSASGEYYIPLSHRTSIDLYYMPNNVPSNPYYIKTSTKTTNENVITTNGFFHVKVTDPRHLIPSDSPVPIPDDQLLFYGESVDVTVPILSGDGHYRVYDQKNNSITLDSTTDEQAGTITYSIKNISSSVRITTASNSASVFYNASIADSLVKISDFTPDSQEIYSDGTVKGETLYYEGIADASTSTYTFVDVDSAQAMIRLKYSNGKNRKLVYYFVGWQISGNNTIYNPGDAIDIKALLSYANEDNEIIINSVWKAKEDNGRIKSVNFYLNLDCEIMDFKSNGFASHHESNYTESVYASGVSGGNTISANLGDVMLIAPPTTEDTAYEVDKTIRASKTNPISGVSIDNFPKDEDVLSALRENNTKLKLGDREINPSDFTTDNFAVRWYVLKYEHSDGWHVDGVLVAKVAKFSVKKIFQGDAQAIEQVKKNFTITVSHDENGTNVIDHTLSLNSAKNETDSSKKGYSSYDPETDTYTWDIVARQDRTYIIKENNYLLSQDKWNHTNQYKIENSANPTDGWLNYPANEGVPILPIAYPNDIPNTAYQSITIRNMYVQSGMLTVSKVDSTTGHGLKNIKFKISKADGTELIVYKKADQSEYSTDNNAKIEGYNELVEDNVLTTDANGFFSIKLAIHGTGTLSEQYYLEEKVPTGYNGPTKIKLTVTDEGTVTIAHEIIEGTTEINSAWISGVGTNILTIKNQSKLLTSVKAKKDWGDTASKLKKPVKVELWRDGAKMDDAIYSQILNEDNNWEYEWHNLPLFTDLDVTAYSIREIMIGDVAYDESADTDGYSDYMVTFDAPLYKEGNDGTYTENGTWLDADGIRHFADHELLTIHNRSVLNKIAFAKVDDSDRPLKGAEFTLYSDEACTKEIETAVSDESGLVSFSQQSSGAYYFKETKVPTGYLPNDTIYKAVVNGSEVVITKNGDDNAISKIVNYYSLRNLEFSFIKTNPDANPLRGAKFGLYKLICTNAGHDHSNELLKLNSDGSLKTEFDDCWELVSVQTSAAKTGLVKFDGLLGNMTYRLVEFQAPGGYMLPQGQWTITYDQSNQPPEIQITAVGLVSKTPAFEKIENNIAPFRLANYKEEDLPSSGGRGVEWYVYGGAVLIALGAVLLIVLLIRRRTR